MDERPPSPHLLDKRLAVLEAAIVRIDRELYRVKTYLLRGTGVLVAGLTGFLVQWFLTR